MGLFAPDESKCTLWQARGVKCRKIQFLAHILISKLHYIIEADVSEFLRIGRREVNIKSEECLVEAAQDGHLDSFAALYERYYNPMVALAYSVLADKHLSEDAAQQTFAIACHDLPKLKSKDKFGAWLASICRNTARQMQRSKSKHVALNEAPPAENENKKDNRSDAVRRAVWKLRAVEREPIVLRFYNGLSYEQIASILDISVQAVNGRLIRGKRKISKYLKRNGFTGGDYETP